jgi:uncharacterized protein (DUF427 family)
LPPVPPSTGWENPLRLPRDHYVRLNSNDYSVHPAVIGRRVLVRADLDRVQVWCDGDVVADHERVWARHQTISDPNHVRAAQLLRQQRFAVVQPAAETEVEQRRLADYDTALGVTGFDGGVAL